MTHNRHQLQPVNPTKPLAPWVGGKSKLAKTIIEQINLINHTTYAEPFVGMGGVFLRRNYIPKAEIINDYSRDVVNFFRVLQRHYQAFLDMIKWRFSSRAEFDRLMQIPADTLTDLERAARFLYLQKVCFGGKPVGRSFGVTRHGPSRFDLTKLVPLLEDVHDRLTAVTIECLPYADFIERYDSDNTLFYLDPPYYECEHYYGKELFERADFEKIAAQLQNIKAKFILSINDQPEIRRIFAGFDQREVMVRYSVAGAQKQSDFAELLISN